MTLRILPLSYAVGLPVLRHIPWRPAAGDVLRVMIYVLIAESSHFRSSFAPRDHASLVVASPCPGMLFL